MASLTDVMPAGPQDASGGEHGLPDGWGGGVAGRALFAIRDDEVAAEALGIDTTRYKVLAFVLGALASGMDRDKRLRLFIDVGTNCEIVLSNGEDLLATAAPAGPAFEAASIAAHAVGAGKAASHSSTALNHDVAHTLHPHRLGQQPRTHGLGESLRSIRQECVSCFEIGRTGGNR